MFKDTSMDCNACSIIDILLSLHPVWKSTRTAAELPWRNELRHVDHVTQQTDEVLLQPDFPVLCTCCVHWERQQGVSCEVRATFNINGKVTIERCCHGEQRRWLTKTRTSHGLRTHGWWWKFVQNTGQVTDNDSDESRKYGMLQINSTNAIQVHYICFVLCLHPFEWKIW